MYIVMHEGILPFLRDIDRLQTFYRGLSFFESFLLCRLYVPAFVLFGQIVPDGEFVHTVQPLLYIHYWWLGNLHVFRV